MDGEVSRLETDERSRLCLRRPDLDLGFDMEDVGGVFGSRVSDLDKVVLLPKDGGDVDVSNSGILLEGESLGDLKVCSGGWSSGISLDLPCS